jgi:hypothetical protein
MVTRALTVLVTSSKIDNKREKYCLIIYSCYRVTSHGTSFYIYIKFKASNLIRDTQ